MIKNAIANLLRRIAESQIESALVESDSGKKALKLWLAIINQRQFNATSWKYKFSNGDSLITRGLNLSDKFLNHSRHLKWYEEVISSVKYRSSFLNQSQSYYKGSLEIWSLQNNSENTANERLEFRWYHRIFSWLINAIDVHYDFDSECLDEKAFFSKLKEHEGIDPDYRENAPRKRPNEPTTVFKELGSIREKYSVAELLNSPQTIFKRMTKPLPKASNTNHKELKSASVNIPKHMQIWSTKLSLHHQIDLSQQQQHVITENQQVQVNIIKDLMRVQETQKWVDNSSLNQVDSVEKQLGILNYKASEEWVEILKEACYQEWKKGNSVYTYKSYGEKDNFRLLVSSTAFEMLLKAKGHVREHRYNFDFESLPLGFFIDKDKDGDFFVLKYNAKYRLYQLATLKDATVRLDVHNPSSAFHVEKEDQQCSTTKDDVLKVFSERGIMLKPKALEFLTKLENDLNVFEFGKGQLCKINAYAFRALVMMAETIDPLSTNGSLPIDKFFNEFIGVLEKFSTIEFGQSSRLLSEEQTKGFHALNIPFEEINNKEEYRFRVQTSNCFLHSFILTFLKGLKDGKEFYSEAQLDALKRFAQFNKGELSWLKTLTYERKKHHDFSEISKGLFYFFDYFSSLGVSISQWDSGVAGLSSLGGFIHLKHILDCISLSGGGQNTAVQQLQAQHMQAIPRDFNIAKAYLRSGYAFVHESMLLGNERYSGNNIPIIITKECFSQLEYGSSYNGVPPQAYCRAMYLRFVASQVDPIYLTQAIKKWEEMTNTPLVCWENFSINNRQYYDILDEALRKNWQDLKNYALSLKTKLDVEPEESVGYIAEAFVNQRLHVFKTERQYPQAQIQALLEKLKLPKQLINELSKSLHTLNELALNYANLTEQELQAEMKSARSLSLEKQIALLRETHCRLTCARSNANPPKGEWLRLEQLFVILIAMKQSSLFQVDTSEGKTLIIQIIAILKVLNGKKTDVLTHNETLASEAADEIQQLANYFGIKVAKKEDSTQAILDADIFYIDTATAVINDLLAQFSNKEKLPGDRRADEAIVDEVDNIVIDINAKTTMQVSQASDEATPDLEAFLIALNHVVRNQLVNEAKLLDKDSQRLFVHQQLELVLKNNKFYQEISKEKDIFDQYMCAAVSAMSLVLKNDYVIEDDNLTIKEKLQTVIIPRKVVRIIHKDTTGRVDAISQWGAGVHQCIAAWEKQQHKDLVIPGNTMVLAEADVALYLQERYKSRNAFTATLGTKSVQKKIEQTLDTTLSVVMPRAVRALEEPANWPLKSKLEGESPSVTPEYNRVYRFPPIYKESKAEHQETLLEAVQAIQSDNQSAIIFLNTINECDELFNYLENRGIKTQSLQILDDTHDPQEATQIFRPSEATVITRAKEAKMITLTTAAGSRGTNFSGVDVGIIAKPSLGRVTKQKSGRIARNMQFGTVYEIYNSDDLEKTASYSVDKETDPMGHRTRISTHENAKELHDLEAINEGEGERRAKWKLQQHYFDYRKTCAKDKQMLDKQWIGFFNQIKKWDDNQVVQDWEKFKLAAEL